MAKPADKSMDISKSSLNCIGKAAAEIFLNSYHVRPDSDATIWGNEKEKEALKEFSDKTGFSIREAGFMIHPEIPEVGATPNAIIIDGEHEDKLIIAQVKCPFYTKHHLHYSKKIIDAGSLKKCKIEYFWQIQGELWVTGAKFSDFISYDPRLSTNSRLYYVVIERDQEAMNKLKQVVNHSILLRNRMVMEFKNGRRKPKRLGSYWA